MIKAIYGTKDILPSDIEKWYQLEELVKRIFSRFNYKEIRTPIFEETSLFKRGIGEETDIVGKEMYTFNDRGETSLTLKPEMTASVVRAFIEHSLGVQVQLNKLFYISPMFRQERPQAGRLRQFHQFGAEALGSENPALDVEMIQMSFDILNSLGLKNLTVKINSLGIPEVRENYKNELRKFLSDKVSKLSEESQKRFEKNILRIFDSKNETDQKILEGAPMLLDFLDENSLTSFNFVKKSLTEFNIPFNVDSKLVRGLDYYTRTTFEISSESVGSQNALCGGGRYDLLVEQLGGKPTPGVGFAAGMERILLACENENLIKNYTAPVQLYIIRLDKDLSEKVFQISSSLRRKNISAEIDYSEKSVKAQMREANKLNSLFTLFIGGEEYQNGKTLIKNMSNGEQKEIPLDKIEEEIISLLGN